MIIDLNRFTKEESVIMPIYDGYGMYHGRRIFTRILSNKEQFSNTSSDFSSATGNEHEKTRVQNPTAKGSDDDVGEENNGKPIYGPEGWFNILIGTTTKIIRRATPLERLRACSSLRKLTIYALGSEGIPTNFSSFKHLGYGESIRIYGLQAPLFATVQVVQWEDGRFYPYEEVLTSTRDVIRRVKEQFEKEGDLLGVRGITPELRYYYLLACLQQQSIRAAEELEKFNLSQAERTKRIAEFQSTFPGRLQSTIERAGGSLVKFSKHGNGWLVHWRIGSDNIKSTITDDFRIISAGFCLSGDDRLHTVSSIINLAKLFKEESFLNITRE